MIRIWCSVEEMEHLCGCWFAGLCWWLIDKNLEPTFKCFSNSLSISFQLSRTVGHHTFSRRRWTRKEKKSLKWDVFSCGSSFSSRSSFTVSIPVQWAWQALKRHSTNLSSSVSSLLCSPSEKMLFIWPEPFAVPFALWGAYRPWDNSKSPSASSLFIKSFLGLLFKSASICLVGETMEGNVRRDMCVRECVWGEGGGGGWTLSLYLNPCVVAFDLISFDAPPLVLLGSLMDWVQALGLRFVSLLLELARYLISFVNSDQMAMVGVKRLSVTYIGCSPTNLLR